MQNPQTTVTQLIAGSGRRCCTQQTAHAVCLRNREHIREVSGLAARNGWLGPQGG